ncbi:MAG: Hsp33 family molecular chaperone HslO [Clostridia bacterium]|nr:Hsp33 family molecular chaperone HslO [Clostridia bacterium]
MKDYIVNAITSCGSIRVIAAVTTDICENARKLHDFSPTACAAVGRALTAAAMIGSTLKGEDDTLTLQFKGNGPIGRVIAVSDSKANVKGYAGDPFVDLPLKKNGHLDVGGAVGKQGYLSVIRDFGLKEPYVGQVELVTGEIAEDLTYYYAKSEQLPSAVALGVIVDKDLTVKSAGGFILQVLPGAMDEDIDRVEKAIGEVGEVTKLIEEGKTPEDIVSMLLKGYEIEYFDPMEPEYHCDCSKDRMARAIISIGKEEIRKIIEEDGKAEVCCQFCDKKHLFTKEELEEFEKIATK